MLSNKYTWAGYSSPASEIFPGCRYVNMDAESWKTAIMLVIAGNPAGWEDTSFVASRDYRPPPRPQHLR